jgi:hypothetical protein
MHTVDYKKMQCPCCQKEIKSCHFDLHAKKHHPTQIFNKCRFGRCYERFLTDVNRMKHEKEIHDSKSKWKRCIYCNKLVLHLSTHINIVHKSEAIKCNFLLNCPNYFHSVKERDEHIAKVHSSVVEDFNCMYCSKMYSCLKSLRVHIEIKHLDVSIRCSFHQCHLYFLSQSERNDHFQKVHQQKEDAKKFQCSKCSYKCATKYHLTSHTKINHSSTTVNVKVSTVSKGLHQRLIKTTSS